MLLLALGYQLKFCYSSRQQFNKNMVGMQQSVINEAIDQWYKRLKSCVKANERQSDHLL